MNTNGQDQIARVRLFGSFSISCGGNVLTEHDMKSDMAVKLAAYLIIRRKHSSTYHEIIEALWPELESENPSGALKNLIYRVRRKLKELWPDREFILTVSGGYVWNPDIPTVVDTEEFKALRSASQSAGDPRKKTEIALRITDLYRGRLLESFSGEYWVMPRQTWYHNAWISTIHTCADIIEEQRNYPQLENLCRRAILIDDRDVAVHCALLKSLIGENRLSAAEEYYRKTIRMLYTGAGEEVPEALQAVYSGMMRQKHSEEMDFLKIETDLKETGRQKGAYFCDYGTFRKLYEVTSRRLRRSGIHVLLLLISMVIESNAGEAQAKIEAQRAEDMERLKVRLMNSLRSGDVVTRYSLSQFLILLPECTKDNAESIMNRVFRDYYTSTSLGRMRIQYNLKELGGEAGESPDEVSGR